MISMITGQKLRWENQTSIRGTHFASSRNDPVSYAPRFGRAASLDSFSSSMIHLFDSICTPGRSQPAYEEVRTKLEPLLETLRTRDPYYEGHIQRACFFGLEFGRLQRLSEKEIRQLYLGAFLHDIGKVLIPGAIINKPGPLDPEERKIMMTHAALGEKICVELGPLDEIAYLVGSHHERPNGTGYPRGLREREISHLSRILAVIEIYDALRSERPYKQPFSLEQSLDILRKSAAAGDLDSNVVEEFAKLAIQKNSTPNWQPPIT